MLILHVDDILLAGNDKQKLEEIREKLSLVFKMKDLGEPDNFLGMRIIRDRQNKTLALKQTEYTEKILERFNMTEFKTQRTPMVTSQVKNSELRSKQNSNESEE